MWPQSFGLSLSLLFIAPLSLALTTPFKRASVCNGHAELCSRSYGNTTFLSSHDSFAISTEEIILARTQEVSLAEQLDLGVRMLQAQAHLDVFKKLHFCHTNCWLYDGGRVVDYLKTVKAWLDKNPNEVLTLIFTNPENLDVKDIWKPAFDDSGITSLAYVPPHFPMKKSEWPTLGELIESGKRVVVFMDYSSDTSKVDFILSEFDMIWEPPFSSTDASFPCKVDRISGALSTSDHMYMLNHNLNKEVVDIGDLNVLVPDYDSIAKTNGLDSINAGVDGCIPASESGTKPNFVMLDFVNKGEGLKAVNKFNGF